MKKISHFFKEEMLLTISIIIISVLALRLAFKPGFNFDENFSMDWTALGWKDMWQNLVNDVHPPLYYIGLKLWRIVFGYSAPAARLYSLLPFAALLSVSCFIKMQFGRKSAVWYLSFLCGTPFVFQKAVEIRMYGWTSLWTVLNGVFLYMILKKKEHKYWGLFCLTGLLTAYNHYYGLLLMAVTFSGLGLFTMLQKNRRLFFSYLRTCIVCVICYLPWLSVAYRQVAQVNQEYWIEWPTSRLGVIRELFYSAIPDTEKVYMLLLLLLPAISFLLFLFFMGRSRKEEAETMLWCLTLLSAVWFVWLISYVYTCVCGRPIMVSRYFIPGISLFILGSCALARKMPVRLVTGFCVLFIAVGSISYFNY